MITKIAFNVVPSPSRQPLQRHPLALSHKLSDCLSKSFVMRLGSLIVIPNLVHICTSQTSNIVVLKSVIVSIVILSIEESTAGFLT